MKDGMAIQGQRDKTAAGSSATRQEVLWLGTGDPPAPFVSFLRGRGLTLTHGDPSGAMPPARLMMIEASSSPAARAPSLARRRLAVMHPDPGSADALAQALRAKGAEVAALSLNPDSLHRVEALDPDVVIMEPADFMGSCWEIVRALWQHPRLRFATVLLANPELMGSEQVSALDVHDLSFAVDKLCQDYERVVRDALTHDELELSLATLGPVRTLRALLESGGSLRAVFSTPEHVIEVDVVERIIVGAQSVVPEGGEEPLLGVHALAFLMTQATGRVLVRQVDRPAQTNVMAPLDTALHMARDTRATDLRSPARERASTRPSGVRWASVANENGRSQPPPSVQPKHTGQGTLLGIPAVKLDLPAPPEKRLSPAKAPPLPVAEGPLARPGVPITTAPPAPRISITPPGIPTAELSSRHESAAPPRASAPPAASVALPTPVSLAGVEQAEAPRASRPVSRLHALWAPLRAQLSRNEAKLAGVALLGVVALWLMVRIAGTLFANPAAEVAASAPTSSSPASAPASPPATSATRPAPATAPPSALATHEEADQEETETVRPSRRASELVSQGHVFRKKRMLPSARSRYLEALREVPGYPRALAGLAQLALQTGDASQAINYARQLTRVRPGQSGYHLLLGDAYQNAGQTKEARGAYQAAARLGNRAAKQRLSSQRGK